MELKLYGRKRDSEETGNNQCNFKKWKFGEEEHGVRGRDEEWLIGGRHLPWMGRSGKTSQGR